MAIDELNAGKYESRSNMRMQVIERKSILCRFLD